MQRLCYFVWIQTTVLGSVVLLGVTSTHSRQWLHGPRSTFGKVGAYTISPSPTLCMTVSSVTDDDKYLVESKPQIQYEDIRGVQ